MWWCTWIQRNTNSNTTEWKRGSPLTHNITDPPVYKENTGVDAVVPGAVLSPDFAETQVCFIVFLCVWVLYFQSMKVDVTLP